MWNKLTILQQSCPGNSYFCFKEKNCISLVQVCNGIKDCLFGEDEENCMNVVYFECKDEKLNIPYQFVCDFIYDCQDKSDETFCGKVNENNATSKKLIFISF